GEGSADGGWSVRAVEAPADRDEPPARDWRGRHARERAETEKDARRVVVDGDPVPRPEEVARRGADVVEPPAALSGLRVVLQGRVARQDAGDRLPRGGGERSPPEVGVQEDAGPVDRPRQGRGEPPL